MRIEGIEGIQQAATKGKLGPGQTRALTGEEMSDTMKPARQRERKGLSRPKNDTYPTYMNKVRKKEFQAVYTPFSPTMQS